MVTVTEPVVVKFPTRFRWFRYVDSAVRDETHRFSAYLEHEDPPGSGMWWPLPGRSVVWHLIDPDGIDHSITMITDSDGFVIRDITFNKAGSWETYVSFGGDDYNEPSETTHLY